MKSFECKDNLGGIEFGSRLVEEYCSYVSLSLTESNPKSSPPGQYSKTKYNFLSSWKEA